MTRHGLHLLIAAGALPAGFDVVRDDARVEGYRFMERLATEWESGAVRFDRDGELLLSAWVNGTLAGVGGITLDPNVSGALRMRRFYVRPLFRRCGIGRALANLLLDHARSIGRPVLVNAGTTAAPAFWEALGFVSDPAGEHTHRLPSSRSI